MSEQPVGFFDSGLGGLTVLRASHELLPDESTVYLGDTARTPYGPKGKRTVLRYARECAEFLCQHDIKMLVVACNTASALALEELQQELSIPVIGTVERASQLAVEATASGRIGVIGTEATISSEVYDQALHDLDPGLMIQSTPCPLFVPVVEQGMFSGEIVDKLVELYLTSLKNLDIDTVVLGCTHYPLLKNAIQKFLGEGVNVVECSNAVAEHVGDVLAGRGELSSKAKGQQSYYVTDEVSQFKQLAALLMGGRQMEVVKVSSFSQV